jgi:hypothetical protein
MQRAGQGPAAVLRQRAVILMRQLPKTPKQLQTMRDAGIPEGQEMIGKLKYSLDVSLNVYIVVDISLAQAQFARIRT